jgi:hypothetical protein
MIPVTPTLPDLEAALATYVDVLCRSAERTNRAEDRPRYQSHLAEAARMFKAIKHDRSLAGLQAIVRRERHSFGWSFLSGQEGDQAEAAFNAFATLVEHQHLAG